jgi:hypothetical protein
MSCVSADSKTEYEYELNARGRCTKMGVMTPGMDAPRVQQNSLKFRACFVLRLHKLVPHKTSVVVYDQHAIAQSVRRCYEHGTPQICRKFMMRGCMFFDALRLRGAKYALFNLQDTRERSVT